MKSLRLLTVAPALLVMTISACAGAKISHDKAKERAEGYDAAAVVEKYASVEVTTKVDVKKNTGVFADGGLLASVVKTIKAQEGTEKAEGDKVGLYVFSADEIDIYKDIEGYTVTYYSYKSKGLKMELKVDAETEGVGKQKGTSNTYILDDGRVEKADTKMKITASASAAGITMEGEFEYALSTTAKWTAK